MYKYAQVNQVYKYCISGVLIYFKLQFWRCEQGLTGFESYKYA